MTRESPDFSHPHLSRDDLIEVLRFAKHVHEAVTYDKVKALEA